MRSRYHLSMDARMTQQLDTRPAGSPPVGRFAPTPSGRMHLGNVFSCLMAWLAVRAAGGRMVLRIEDLDPRARDRGVGDLLMDDLAWLGLDWDEGPFFQSERDGSYAEALEVLGDEGITYPCFCTRQELHAATAPHASDGTYVYQGTCRDLTAQEAVRRAAVRPPATRLLVPGEDDPAGTIAWDDMVFGSQEEVLALDCGDFLVRRSDGIVAYQLAVVADDASMGVTQVVRGRDLIGSTARQIYLQRLLGLPSLTYAHAPLLVAPDGRRLSKRERDLDLGALRNRFPHPEPILGRLAQCVGMVEPGERLSACDLVGRFSWEKLSQHRDDIVVGEDFL